MRLRLPSLSAAQYRRVTGLALVLLVLIVVTGASVRLTGSGLGCTDWPNCEDGKLIAPLDFHPMVEFVNRMITGLVSVVVIVAVLGSLGRRPRRRDLTWLSFGLVAGVIAQIVLGGIVVLFDLNPVLVQGHFVVSMLLIADAVLLHHRAGQPDGSVARPLVTPAVQRFAVALVALSALVILTGTVVTGAGPHAGDEKAKRLDITVHAAARIHGTVVIVFLAAVLATLWLLRREPAPAPVQRAAEGLLGVLVLQGAIGYTQYFTQIPPLLVGLHVFGACAVWISVLQFVLRLSAPTSVPRESGRDDDGPGRTGPDRGRPHDDAVAHR